jgi:hypothetical protein
MFLSTSFTKSWRVLARVLVLQAEDLVLLLHLLPLVSQLVLLRFLERFSFRILAFSAFLLVREGQLRRHRESRSLDLLLLENP